VATASSSTPESRLRQRFARQWPIAIAGLIVTVVLCVATMRLVGPSYSAKASVVLTPPPTASTATTTGNPNPYLNMNGMQGLADIFSLAMTSSSSRTTLQKAGFVGSYTVARDTTSDGPIVTVTTKAKTPEQALADLRLVLYMSGPQLTRMQVGQVADNKDLATASVVSRDTQANPSRKSQIRALAVALVVGLLGTALAVSVVDMLTQRRRARRGYGRPVRRLRTAPAPGEAPAGSALALFSARIRGRLSLLIGSITRNGRGRNRKADGPEGSPESSDSGDSGDSDDSPDSAKPPAARARARRRPRPGPAPDIPEVPGHSADAPPTGAEQRPGHRADAPPTGAGQRSASGRGHRAGVAAGRTSR
jgi:hypothetical protein